MTQIASRSAAEICAADYEWRAVAGLSAAGQEVSAVKVAEPVLVSGHSRSGPVSVGIQAERMGEKGLVALCFVF